MTVWALVELKRWSENWVRDDAPSQPLTLNTRK